MARHAVYGVKSMELVAHYQNLSVLGNPVKEAIREQLYIIFNKYLRETAWNRPRAWRRSIHSTRIRHRYTGGLVGRAKGVVGGRGESEGGEGSGEGKGCEGS